MITNESLLRDIPQLVNQVSTLITQKVCVIPFKVSYAISKNAAKAREVEVAMVELRKEIDKKYCVMENGKTKVVMAKNEQGQDRIEPVFIDDEAKLNYAKEVGDFMSQEPKFKPHKIDMAELEQINNLPPNVISVMDKYGIIA